MHTRGLIQRAIVMTAAFALLHLLGGRTCTSLLSGTPPVAGGQSVLPSLTGAAYVVGFIGTTVVAPILLIAACCLALIRRWSGRANSTRPAKEMIHAHDKV